MRTMIDFDGAPVFAIPVGDGAGGLSVREGVLLEGPQGWGEFSPLPTSTPDQSARWLTAATEPGTVGWPEPLRGSIAIAATIPSVSPGRAAELVRASGCRVAEVAVATRGGSIADDVARTVAVRDALGAGGAVRIDAGGRWDVDTAVRAISAITDAVGDLQFVQQPCRTIDEVAVVRRRVDVRVAVGVDGVSTGRDALTDLVDAADVAVLSCGPLGGVRRALRLAERLAEARAMPCVVASTYDTSIGVAAGLALAGALPELPFDCALGTCLLLEGDVTTDARSLRPRAGRLPVAPMPPGPDPVALARFAVTDATTVARWHRRVRSALG